MVVQVLVAPEVVIQVRARVEAPGAQQVSDPAVDAPHNPVGLRPLWPDQTMLDPVFGAQPAERVAPGGLAFSGGRKASVNSLPLSVTTCVTWNGARSSSFLR